MEREKRRSAARAAAEYQKPAQNQGWVGWLWGGAPRPAQPQADEDADMRANLNEEEYQKLEEIVSEQEAAVKQGARLLSEGHAMRGPHCISGSACNMVV